MRKLIKMAQIITITKMDENEKKETHTLFKLT